MKLTKTIKLTLLLVTSLFCANALCYSSVFATDDVCESSASAEIKEAAGCSGSGNLTTGITNILNAIIGVIGLVAVIFIIIGGVNYMTSNGDPQKTKKAKDTILYATIGLIICALAFAIVNFVIRTILDQ
jgi:hypothetical protein